MSTHEMVGSGLLSTKGVNSSLGVDITASAHTSLKPEEIWKSVGYGYEVSSAGRVRRHGVVKKPGVVGPMRYRRIAMLTPGKKIFKNVHSLVAEAFIGPRPPGFECCHNDGNVDNNHVSNLRYAMPKENQADRVIHGRTCRGSRNPNCKLTREAVTEILTTGPHDAIAQRRFAEKYEVTVDTIRGIVRSVAWRWLREELGAQCK